MGLAEQASLGIVQSAQERRSLLTVLKIANVGGIVHLVMLLQFALLGPPQLVAGVIGRKKFAYDLWGDTVNTAARMESHGLPGEIQVSQAVQSRLPPSFQLRERGLIEIKGKGPLPTWLLTGESGE